MSGALAIGQTLYERAVMLDTGPIISLYDPDDQRGEQVLATLTQMQALAFPVCITIITIAEIHRNVLYRCGHQRAREFLSAISDGSIQIIAAEREDQREALRIIEAYPDQPISYCDAISMAIMKRLRIGQVLSYDYHFWIMNFIIPPEIFSLRAN